MPKFLGKAKSFDSYLEEKLKNPELKKEYDALEPEFAIIQAMINARKESGLTQQQLSDRTGITQADISRLESGNANPSLRTLQHLAEGLGMKLRVEFVRPAKRETQPSEDQDRKAMMEYKGYHASIRYSDEDKLFVGEVIGINASLGFHGSSVDELERMFHQSIDNYLAMYAAISKAPA